VDPQGRRFFTAERPFGTFTGKVAGSEIKFKVTFNDQS
jgi:hypothetical protein